MCLVTLGRVSFSLGSNHAAEDLFQDVLRRKDRADATRNALGVLHRFKWLFNLPHTIDTNITKVMYFILLIYLISEMLLILIFYLNFSKIVITIIPNSATSNDNVGMAL